MRLREGNSVVQIRHHLTIAMTLLAVVSLGIVKPAQADPPPWAPAHGYRHKQKHKYKHYDHGYQEVYDDFGIHSGHCNREAVVGTLLGYIIGSNIGHSMDDADRYCTGQVLEYADNGQTVTWTNPDLNTAYHVTPRTAYESEGRRCRDYTTREVVKEVVRRIKVTACRQSDSSWRIVNK